MDDVLFHVINSLAGHYDGIDDSFEVIARFAPFALIAILLGLWVWPAQRSVRDDRQWACISAAISTLVALGINQIIIQVWERPRPFAAHQAVLLLKPSHDPSFPSDHSTFGFAVAVAIVLAARRAGIAALVIASILAFSRVYVGEHYVGDVFAGAVIGGLTALTINQLRPVMQPVLDPPLRLARRLRLG